MESCMIKKAVILEFQKLPLLAENVYRILFLTSFFFMLGSFYLPKLAIGF
jgi:hypothetical protein